MMHSATCDVDASTCAVFNRNSYMSIYQHMYKIVIVHEPMPLVTKLALADNTSLQTGIYYCSSLQTGMVSKFGLAYLS